MRTMLFMSRMVGMVIVMIAVLLSVFVFLDIMRQGSHAQGFLLGSDIWRDLQNLVDAYF